MRIGACIITYNPDLSVLKKGIESLMFQVEKIIVVDNGSNGILDLEVFCKSYEKIHLISLGKNRGIAIATNKALVEFQKQQYDFVLTSDQDSSYPSDYIKNFKKDNELLQNEDIAAYTPIFFDENEQCYAKIIVESFFFMRSIKVKDDFTDVFHAIASGMIINLSLLQEIGMMNEDLFIDWVDLEWCWKARYYNKRIVCCRNLTIHHKLGDTARNIGYRKVSIRSWVRNYYITRNSFYLALHTKYLRKISKFILFIKSFRYILGYTVLCKEHIRNLKYTLLGMHDGITNRLGMLEEKK